MKETKFALTLWWIAGFALLITPLQAQVVYEQRIADLQWQESWLRARFMDCVDAGNVQRLYFPSGNYVEFKCDVIEDTTLKYARKKKPKLGGGIGRRGTATLF